MQNMKRLCLWAVQWALVGALLALLGACGAQQEAPAKPPLPVVNQTTSTFTASAKGLTVTFDASAFSGTQTTTMSPASFQWNFGDGTPVQSTTSVTITHVYAASGTYMVNLVVLDAQGVAGKVVSQNVTVAPIPVNQAPLAAFVATTGVTGVVVDALQSSDPDGTITSYAWTFGEANSTSNSASGRTATHIYSGTGSFTVTLVVTDNTGLTATSAQPVVINGAPNMNPVATFTFVTNALLVNVSAAASTDNDGTISFYNWNFGEPMSNANTAAGITATHAYRFAGSYTVTLAVTDNLGAQGLRSFVVTVSPPAAIATGALNDTGITASQCYQAGSDNLISCTSTAAIGLNNAQDGMVGRDVSPSLNTVVDGQLGFSFTKIGASGETLPASATQWSCVKDNITGLIWENKTNDGGFQDSSKTYTNYDSTAEAQLSSGGNPTQAQIDAANNTVGFINAVNAAGLCGATDWRLPAGDELMSIIDYSSLFTGSLDPAWFTVQSNTLFFVWQSGRTANQVPFAAQTFQGGIFESGRTRDTPIPVRLVRGSFN
jgi:PKD repeat protein